MKWTNEQNNAIYKKGTNILVAAAAGSGKTAVLVERIIQKILNDGIDIDKLLVVTFTNAAASEMRERVLDAIYKKLDEQPDNENLQKQIILLGKSNICTIHSFCLDVIKNNFFEIDISANFRIGTEEEISLLKQETLEDVFENLYEENDEEFEKLINTYTNYRGDENLKQIVLSIHSFMQSSPFPNEWLLQKIEMFAESKNNDDFSKSVWGKILLKNLSEEIIDGINSLKIIKNKLDLVYELEKYKLTIENDIEVLNDLYKAVNSSWDKAYEFAKNITFKTWPRDKNIVTDLKEDAKKTRDSVISKFKYKGEKSIVKDILTYNSESAYNDIYEMHDILKILGNLIINFDTEFKKRKKEKNIIDFNDIEHYALRILVKKDENGNYIPTDVAKKYQEKFEEIAIDEYQDSNQVQEFILNMISRENNIFMVGDVKQSIYKFRLACPELFLQKYNNYSLENDDAGIKIQLFKNFRSRKNVLDLTNTVLEAIMSSSLGDNVEYDEKEYLNLGAEFDEVENGLGIAELDIIDLKEDDEMKVWKDDDDCEEESDDNQNLAQLEKEEIEAKFVANRIKNLIITKKKVKDKNGYRDITYKDIVILLRSTSRLAPIYEKELIKNDIPVFSDSSNEYLDTIEIQTIINVLKILNNPIDDIALVAVLRSEIGTFTDNEILQIRLCNRSTDFYTSLLESKEKLEGELKEKVINFLNSINKWRVELDYLSLAELIWKIYTDTGFYNYVGLMPNGTLRQANLKLLFEISKEYEKTSFKGLFNFIRFIERLKSGNSDMSSAKIIGENENVVRIMSIHKSKGLEFPVVFLCSTAKKINMQDLKLNLLLHQKIGIGPQYINYEKKIEYSTSAKDAIKIVLKEEAIAEEMRILYVALTRAKEKLIITGTFNNYNKELEKKKELLKIYNSKSRKINSILLKKYISYLDWLQLVFLNQQNEKIISINEYKKQEILRTNEEKENKIREFNFEKKFDYEKYEKEFYWTYKNLSSTKLPIKSTVSKVKQMQEEYIEFNELNSQEIGIKSVKPSFMDVEKNITASQKGTLMHLFLQKVNLKENYSTDKLEYLKQELVSKNIISDDESKFIDTKKVMNFLNSDLAKKIKKCKIIEKEKAFCKKIDAKEVFKEANNETILVQGIIDLFAIQQNDEVILVDYKTDFIELNDEEILIKKYKKQLEIYKDAIEEALNLKVSEVYIYSLFLNKEIIVNL